MNTMVEVWQEARVLFRRLDDLTRVLGERITAGQVEDLVSLLDDRQRLCDRLDQLKAENGIGSWVRPEPDPKLSAAVTEHRQEIGEIFQRLIRDDERNRRALQGKMDVLKSDMEQVREMRRVDRLYQGIGGPADGIFIDSKR